ncbi:MAG: hypothetical protein KBA31_18225 [Alphaproteobacteria bacterium]|nr:hypothetical protein [Alphaproteobacteria bacterium]
MNVEEATRHNSNAPSRHRLDLEIAADLATLCRTLALGTPHTAHRRTAGERAHRSLAKIEALKPRLITFNGLSFDRLAALSHHGARLARAGHRVPRLLQRSSSGTCGNLRIALVSL